MIIEPDTELTQNTEIIAVWVTANLSFIGQLTTARNTANLSMSMLASLWSGHINDLTSPVLQYNVAIFSERGALLRYRFRSTRSCSFKIIVCFIRHDPIWMLQAKVTSRSVSIEGINMLSVLQWKGTLQHTTRRHEHWTHTQSTVTMT